MLFHILKPVVPELYTGSKYLESDCEQLQFKYRHATHRKQLHSLNTLDGDALILWLLVDLTHFTCHNFIFQFYSTNQQEHVIVHPSSNTLRESHYDQSDAYSAVYFAVTTCQNQQQIYCKLKQLKSNNKTIL